MTALRELISFNFTKNDVNISDNIVTRGGVSGADYHLKTHLTCFSSLKLKKPIPS